MLLHACVCFWTFCIRILSHRTIVITKRSGASSLEQLTTEIFKFSRLLLYATKPTRLPVGLHLADRAANNRLNGIDFPDMEGINDAWECTAICSYAEVKTRLSFYKQYPWASGSHSVLVGESINRPPSYILTLLLLLQHRTSETAGGSKHRGAAQRTAMPPLSHLFHSLPVSLYLSLLSLCDKAPIHMYMYMKMYTKMYMHMYRYTVLSHTV